MSLSKRTFGIICSIPGFAILIGLLFYPTIYNVYTSFLRYNNISPIVFNGIKNYEWIFTSSSSYFLLSWWVSTVYSVGSAGLAFVLALILAHSLHKVKKGGSVFRTLSILPWATPLVISGLIWKWMLNKEIGIINHLLLSLKLINTNLGFLSAPNLAMLSGILTTAWYYVPFMTVLFLAGLESIPSDLYEAAQMDGADGLQRFWHVSLPLNRYQMLVGFLIVLMFTFRTPDAFFALTGGGPAKSTYHAGLFLMDMIYSYLDFGRAGAISVVLCLTVVGFTFPILYYGIIKRSTS